jgi:hypothetical protein
METNSYEVNTLKTVVDVQMQLSQVALGIIVAKLLPVHVDPCHCLIIVGIDVLWCDVSCQPCTLNMRWYWKVPGLILFLSQTAVFECH